MVLVFTIRLHHLTYTVDNREAILRVVDICLKHGVFIETEPHKNTINQMAFLYVYEPGANRFEIANAGARLIYAPDWKTIVWSEEERNKGQAWGLPNTPIILKWIFSLGWRVFTKWSLLLVRST
jgi:catechol 2,3-dioxygenase